MERISGKPTFSRRLPAEWEDQDGVLLAWPHGESDWLPHLHLVEPVFLQIAREISRFERVVVTTPEPQRVFDLLASSDAEMDRIDILPIGGNDTWARDFGPITVMEDGDPVLLDFIFNGWGLKFAADRDNLVSRRLSDAGLFRAPLRSVGLVLEGGSIESDGKGTLLTTSACLLSPNRNPHLGRREIESELKGMLGAGRILWLENGRLDGDDTDSHIDTLARLCPDETIIHVACDRPEDGHFPAISAMAEELSRFTTMEGRDYRLIPLPWPRPIFDEDGMRLPATYANFLVINGAVLVPTYDDPGDDRAITAIGSAFPGREIIGIDCRPLILQHGSLHCVTMQLPKGTLSTELKGVYT